MVALVKRFYTNRRVNSHESLFKKHCKVRSAVLLRRLAIPVLVSGTRTNFLDGVWFSYLKVECTIDSVLTNARVVLGTPVISASWR